MQPILEAHSSVRAYETSADAIAFSPDGRRAISTKQGVRKIWNVEDLLRGTTLPTSVIRGTAAWFDTAVTFSRDGEAVLSAATLDSHSDKSIVQLWEVESGSEYMRIEMNGWINTLAMSADGNRLITTSHHFHSAETKRNLLRVWDLPNGVEVFRLEIEKSVYLADIMAVTQAGNVVVRPSSDNRSIEAWDLSRSERIYSVPGYYGLIDAIAVSTDGNVAFCAFRPESWSLSYPDWVQPFDLSKGRWLSPPFFEDGAPCVRALALAQDGNVAISVSASPYRTLRLWNMATGKLIAACNLAKHVRRAAISADGRSVLVENGGEIDFLRFKEWSAVPSYFPEAPRYVTSPRRGQRAEGSLDAERLYTSHIDCAD